MKKRIFGMMLTFLMVAGSVPVFAGEADTPVLNMYLMTRAAVAEKLYEMEGSPAVEQKSSFLDVTEDMTCKDAVAWAAEKGIVSGYSEEAFGPKDYIRREQMASVLFRYAKWKGLDVSVGENTNILSYEDVFDISEYAIPAVQWACGTGIMADEDGYIYPDGYVAGPTVEEWFKAF